MELLNVIDGEGDGAVILDQKMMAMGVFGM